MMNLQDELREAQVNLAVQTARNEIASAKQQVAERSLELVNQGMQLLEQEKDEWKRRVGEMQPEPLETQRYEAASAPRAAGQPARDEGVPRRISVRCRSRTSWMRRAQRWCQQLGCMVSFSRHVARVSSIR